MSTKREKRAKNRLYQAQYYQRKKDEGKTLVKIWVTPEEKEVLLNVIDTIPEYLERKRKKDLSTKS